MSGPARSDEAEQVLASIRRVISGQADPSDPVETADTPTRHLVLTPAQRVDAAGSEDPRDLDEPPAGRVDAESAPLDEATLRALVTEILHEELAGELGERITKNLRKLVRREIKRAIKDG